MNQSRRIIESLSPKGEDDKKPAFKEGDAVRIVKGNIHGRPSGTIRRLFSNGKASVVARVRGVEKVFHPSLDDLALVESKSNLEN